MGTFSKHQVVKAVTIDYPHEEIHEGDSFTAHYAVAVSDTNHRTAISFKTGATAKHLHMIVEVHGTAASVAYLYENAVIVGGTAGQPGALLAYNRNRNSTNTSTIISTHSTPVVGGLSSWTEALLLNGGVGVTDNFIQSTATELDTIPLGGGTNPISAIGGTSRGSQEFILEEDTVYLVMIQSSNADDNTHKIRLDWYEHTGV